MHVSQYPLFQIKGSIQITAPGRGWKPCPPDPTSASGSCLPPLSRCLSDTCNVPGFMPVLGLTDKWGQCGSCPQGICNPVIIWKSPSSMKETRYCVEKEGHWGAWFCPASLSIVPQLSPSCHYHQQPSSKGALPLYGLFVLHSVAGNIFLEENFISNSLLENPYGPQD